MRAVITLLLFSSLVMAQTQQNTSQFKALQDDLITQSWDLSIDGIFLSETIALTARQFEYVNFEIGLIEVPILLKIKVTDKLSILAGVKLDFYRTSNGISREVGISASSGLHYDVNKNTYIQGVSSYQINQSRNIYDYNYGFPSSFMLRSGFKF